MRIFATLALVLFSSAASADQGDREIDMLNLCMYRNALTSIQLGLKPSDMRGLVNSVCEKEIDRLIRALMPQSKDGKFSIDVEGYEIDYKKAKESKLLKFVVDDFLKKYADAYRSTR